MKTLHLTIIVILIFSTLLYLKPIQADNVNDIEIQNIQTLPSAIIVGQTFKINATLVNNSSNPIFVGHGSCGAPFSVTFDSHVLVSPNNINCTDELIEQKLNPGEKITATSPYIDLVYKAAEAGNTNATVTFSYGLWNQTNQSNIEKTISQSFLFTILDKSEQTSSVMPISQKPLNDAIMIPFKDSEVVAVGKVITVNSTVSENKTQYSIAVEKYIKNPKPYDLLTAVGDGIRKEITDFSKTKYYNAPIFEEGDRAFLYLNQKNGKYVISSYSFGITKSLLGSPEHVDFTVYQNQYYGKDVITISGRIEKGYLYASAAEYGANSTVSIMVSNPKNQRYLSDIVDVKPDGSFSYKFKIKGELGITGDYESDLNVGYSTSGIAFQYFALPLKQLESGISKDKIKCREDLELLFKPSNSNPACVTPDTAGKLIKRGWQKELKMIQ